jgi:hypothetical protein
MQSNQSTPPIKRPATCQGFFSRRNGPWKPFVQTEGCVGCGLWERFSLADHRIRPLPLRLFEGADVTSIWPVLDSGQVLLPTCGQKERAGLACSSSPP